MVFIVGAVFTAACSGSTGGHGDGGTGASGGAGAFDPLEGALVIHGAVVPDASCESPTVLDPELTEGQWDFASANRYLVFLVAENTLESRTDAAGQGELNNIFVDALDITLLGSDGSSLDAEPLPNPYRVPVTAVIPAAAGGQPSLEVISASALPASFADGLGQLPARELTAQLQAIGSIADGSKVRSATFLLPIRLCERCLAADCPAPQVPDGSCIPGQDGHPWCSL